ncbi:glutathione-dependent formaldehyde-activating enzyme [Phlyctema vagabunda]|uniref:Glutathione-dependent formaldehyde-activating enzyme n=1 Tax=Phlyctema vagabunda TaxID=108571 RepID=A0ABR4PK64_9HELO
MSTTTLASPVDPQHAVPATTQYQPVYRKACCGCGAVKFEVLLHDPLVLENECTCPLCQNQNFEIHHFDKRDVVITEGADSMKEKRLFTKLKQTHKFCNSCGGGVMIEYQNSKADGEQDKIGVNVRSFPLLFCGS